MAKVSSISVDLYISTSEFPITFADSNGNHNGTYVLDQLINNQNIYGVASDDTVSHIPFESVDHAVITRTYTDYVAPVDEMCVTD